MRTPTKRQKQIIAVVVPLSVMSTMFALRDLSQRDVTQVRGSKTFWRVFMLLNTGNSLLYWLFGRRT